MGSDLYTTPKAAATTIDSNRGSKYMICLFLYIALQRLDVFGEGVAPGVGERHTVQGILPRKVFSTSM